MVLLKLLRTGQKLRVSLSLLYPNSLKTKGKRKIIKEAGCEQKEDIELIAGKVKLVPEILNVIDYRFDRVDDKLEEIEKLLQSERTVFSIGKQETGHDSFQAGRDIIIQQFSGEKVEQGGKKAESEHKPAKEKAGVLWPEGSLPLDGPKVSEPFAGRGGGLEGRGGAVAKGARVSVGVCVGVGVLVGVAVEVAVGACSKA